MVIDIAVGKKPDYIVSNLTDKAVMVKFILSKNDYIQLENFKTNHSDKIYAYGYWRDFNEQMVKDSSQRFGYIIFQCDTREECLKLIPDSIGGNQEVVQYHEEFCK